MTTPFIGLSDEELLATVEAVQTLGKAGASRALDISYRAVTHRMASATSRNLLGDYMGGPLPAGRFMGKVTVQREKDGSVVREWQRQMPQAEELAAVFDDLTKVMQSAITPLPLIDVTVTHDMYPTPTLTLYPIVDVHLGMYAWAKESGENYDLEIAKTQFLKSTSDLMRMSPNSDEGLIVVLGDFFHADNNNAQTERSHNHLDVDGRHDKVLHLGTELLIWTIDMALQKHEKVTVKVMRGNHDPYASKALAMALYFRYQGQNNERVTIDRSPLDMWSYQFGQVMLSFTHGDNVKAGDMSGAMAANEAEMWGKTKYRYGFSGHFHKSKAFGVDEKHGAISEVLPAFTAKDAWNKSMGHSSLRTITSQTFGWDTGRMFRQEVNI
jgi:hypothetical protein